jgi:hypothetical protein
VKLDSRYGVDGLVMKQSRAENDKLAAGDRLAATEKCFPNDLREERVQVWMNG